MKSRRSHGMTTRLAISCPLTAILALLLSGAAVADDPPSTFRARAGKVTVIVDTNGAPEVTTWAITAQGLVLKWFPIIEKMLHTEGFTPTSEVKLVFKKDRKGPAGTSGSTIEISAAHVQRNPGDYGMVIHELVHVLQRYPRFDKETWWLVEGIADYIRYFKYEPNVRMLRIDPAKASYKQGYKTSARFLAWIESRYDKKIVIQLNQALRDGDYTPALFQKYTGKDLDQLWAEFVRSPAAAQK
jgi:hypothetical protein